MLNTILVIWMHFIGDFILQNDWMAQNKSKSNFALLIHSAMYSLPLILFGLPFALVNGVAHFVVDYFTSRWSSRLYSEGKRHWFFVVIGLDQAIHMTILLVTLSLK